MSLYLNPLIPKDAQYFNVFRFGSFEFIRSKICDSNGQLSASGKIFAGLAAGIGEAIVAVTPMETIKVKFINDQRSENPRFKGLFHGIGQIVKAEGITGIYKGVTATIVKQGSNQAIRFYVMESLRDWYKVIAPDNPTVCASIDDISTSLTGR